MCLRILATMPDIFAEGIMQQSAYLHVRTVQQMQQSAYLHVRTVQQMP